jgi:hypothetical protein
MIRVGDYIQWECAGVYQFNTPARVSKFSPCRRYCFIEGNNTGIPVHEVIVIENKFNHMTEWKRLCERLHAVMGAGHGDSQEAENLREKMDLHWFCLTDKERIEVNEFNLQLYERFMS